MVKHTPLSWNEEHDFAGRIKAGDTEARNQLVLANMRFGLRMARQWHETNSHIPYSEFLSAAHCVLLEAADRFDGTRGFRFIS
ncbi:hypothetical protein BK004_04185 [bacterium CG10_46_32]|nr:MAG: hypothetical protein BK004_04185 [bacterium CG10_46_32]PIR55816.1 MAG: hypothetical protein COU73_04225 [Parcubacteria group bacterium CG10_big_fil_rev_8_21_14_0_10_46_32]